MSVGIDLARRVRTQHSLPDPADQASLLQLLTALGVPFLFVPNLGEPAVFLSGTHPFALFETGVSPHVIAHECFHAASSAADTEATLYQYRAREADAEDFARELCRD